MSFEFFIKLKKILPNTEDHIAQKFVSVSSSLYDKPSLSTHKTCYFEIIMFAFLEFIFNHRDLKKFKEFLAIFQNSLDYLNSRDLIEKTFIKNYSNYSNFKEMREELLHILRSYEYLFFYLKQSDFTYKELAKSKNSSQIKLHLILKLFLFSKLKQLISQEKSSKEKKLLDSLCEQILIEDFDPNDDMLNMLIGTCLKTNIRIYTQKNSVFFDCKCKKEDCLYIFKIKDGEYRLLSNQTALFVQEKEKIIKKYEDEKEIMEKKMEIMHKNKALLEKEVNILRNMYTNSLGILECVSKGAKKYLKIVVRKDDEASMKFENSKTIRKNFSNIIEYEKILKKKNMKTYDSREKLNSIGNHINKMQEIMHEISSSMTILEKMDVDNLSKYSKGVEQLDLDDKIPYHNNNMKSKIIMPGIQKINSSSEFDVGNKLKKTLSVADLDVGKIVPKEETMVLCPICGEEKFVEEIRTFDCDCKLCIECLKGYLKERYDSCKYELDIPCFNRDCKAKKPGVYPPVSIYFIEECLGKEILTQMMDVLAGKLANKQCSNTKCNFTFAYNENDLNDFLICPECKFETCVQCWGPRHKGKPCTKVEQSLKEFLDNSDMRLRFCPNVKCLAKITKDANCEKVTCPECKCHYCFSCSYPMTPIKAHGLHHHRPDCKLYRAWEDDKGNDIADDKFEQTCTVCMKERKVCERPKLTTKEFYASVGIDQFFIDRMDREKEEEEEK